MTITELINLLTKEKEERGNLECYIELWGELLEPEIRLHINNFETDEGDIHEKYLTIAGEL